MAERICLISPPPSSLCKQPPRSLDQAFCPSFSSRQLSHTVSLSRQRRLQAPLGRRAAAARAAREDGGPGGSIGSQRWLRKADPYEVLGVAEGVGVEDIRAAFRDKVKEFHPDVYRGDGDAEAITMRLIRAYELLVDGAELAGLRRRRSADPFVDPDEDSARLTFVNELNCIGTGCPYSCVARAPNTFFFAEDTSRARAFPQGGDTEYDVHLAVGQCPRSCIHYVTSGQRAVLEDMVRSIVDGEFTADQVALSLAGLISRANFENGRARAPPKRAAARSGKFVDWF